MYKCFLAVLLILKAASQPIERDFNAFEADILKDVASFYHAGCIVAAGPSTGLWSARKIVQLEKKMEKYFVATGLRDLQETEGEYKCRRNRPLYVIFDGDETRDFLERVGQIPSYPRWLLFLNGNSTIEESLSGVSVPFDCEFLTVNWMDDVADMNLVFRVHDTRSLEVEPFATWAPNTGLRVSVQESLYERRSDLQGLQLKALAATGGPPAVIVDRSSGVKGQAIISGFIGNIWHLLGDVLNFRTEFIPCDDTAGIMILTVDSHGADCVLADVTMVGPRLEKGKFLMTLITSKLRLIIRKPDEVGVEWDVLLAPFDKRLWATFSLSLLVVGLCLAYVQSKTKRHRRTYRRPDRLGDSLLSVIGLFCHQGCDMSYQPTSAKTLIITVSLSSVVFMAAYSGVLISFLEHQDLMVPFESLQGLADDGTYKLGTLQGAATLEMFNNATSPLYRRMYDEFFYHNGSGLPRYSGRELPLICTERIAFLATMEYKEKNEKSIKHACKMIWLDEMIRPLSSSIVVAKTWPYRGVVDHWLHRMRDSGTLNYLRLSVWPARRSFAEPPPEFTSLTFKHVAPILSMLALGVVAAIIILLLEVAAARWAV